MSLEFKVVYSLEALKQFKKLDKQVAERIIKWVDDRLVGCDNPKLWGAALVGGLSGFWKYRVGDYRLICEIRNAELIVHVLDVGSRKEIYR